MFGSSSTSHEQSKVQLWIDHLEIIEKELLLLQLNSIFELINKSSLRRNSNGKDNKDDVPGINVTTGEWHA